MDENYYENFFFSTISLNANTAISHMSLHQTKIKLNRFKGKFLWNGRIGVITRFMLDLPWKLSWQVCPLFISINVIQDCCLLHTINTNIIIHRYLHWC